MKRILLLFLTIVAVISYTSLTSCTKRPYAPKQYTKANKNPRPTGSRKPDFTQGRRFR